MKRAGLVLVPVALLLLAAFALHRFPLRYLDAIETYAAMYDLPVELVCAVIAAESRFNKDAVSPKEAGGLMQITPPTAQWLAEQMGIDGFAPERIFEPDLNIRIGCFYLRMLSDRYGGRWDLALSAYNAGSANVNRWLRDEAFSADGQSLHTIPFPETRNYVAKVESLRKIYRYRLMFKEL